MNNGYRIRIEKQAFVDPFSRKNGSFIKSIKILRVEEKVEKSYGLLAMLWIVKGENLSLGQLISIGVELNDFIHCFRVLQDISINN